MSSDVLDEGDLSQVKEKLSKFKRLHCIGRGSSGEAWLVERAQQDGSIEQLVLKEIPFREESGEASPQALPREKVLQEARLLASLHHPYVLSVVDYHVLPDKLVMVLPYAAGGDLCQLVEARAAQLEADSNSEPFLDEVQLLRWFCELLSALQYLHRKKVLHRDIKTKNIFLSGDHSVRLGDFGVARVLDTTDAKAQTMTGTPYYYSPELCTNALYGPKSDVWQLGVCMYELMALRRPFLGANMMMVVRSIMTKEPPPLPERFSKHLRAVVMGMLEKDADKRPSVNDILESPFISGIFRMMEFQRTALAKPSSSSQSSSALPSVERLSPMEADSAPTDGQASSQHTFQVAAPTLVDSGLFSLSVATPSASTSPASASLQASMRQSVSSSMGRMVDAADRLGFTHFELSKEVSDSQEAADDDDAHTATAKMMNYLYVKQRGESRSSHKPAPIALDSKTLELELRSMRGGGRAPAANGVTEEPAAAVALSCVTDDPGGISSTRESPNSLLLDVPEMDIVGSLSGSEDASDSEYDENADAVHIQPDISDIPTQEIQGSLSSEEEEAELEGGGGLKGVPVVEADGFWSDEELPGAAPEEAEMNQSIEALFALDSQSRQTSDALSEASPDSFPSQMSSSRAELYKLFQGNEVVEDDDGDSDDDAVAYLVAMQTAMSTASAAASKARSTLLHKHALVPIGGGLPWMCDGPHCSARSIEGAQGFHCGVGCNYDLCISCVEENEVPAESPQGEHTNLAANPFDSEATVVAPARTEADEKTASWKMDFQMSPVKRSTSEASSRYDASLDVSLEEEGMQQVLGQRTSSPPSFQHLQKSSVEKMTPKQLRQARGVHSAPARRPLSFHTRSRSDVTPQPSSARGPKKHLQLLYNRHGMSPASLSRVRSASVRGQQQPLARKLSLGSLRSREQKGDTSATAPSRVQARGLSPPAVRRAHTFTSSRENDSKHLPRIV